VVVVLLLLLRQAVLLLHYASRRVSVPTVVDKYLVEETPNVENELYKNVLSINIRVMYLS
jgi:hypothetical protein